MIDLPTGTSLPESMQFVERCISKAKYQLKHTREQAGPKPRINYYKNLLMHYEALQEHLSALDRLTTRIVENMPKQKELF